MLEFIYKICPIIVLYTAQSKTVSIMEYYAAYRRILFDTLVRGNIMVYCPT